MNPISADPLEGAATGGTSSPKATMEPPNSSPGDMAAQLARLEKNLDLQKEIAALRMDLTLQLSHFKWAAWTAGICLAFVGFFGLKQWSDFTASAKAQYEKQLSEMRDRYSNLAKGFSLGDNGRQREAIPYLLPAYESNRYDEPVLRSLLDALYVANDCDEALLRVKEVRQDNARFMRMRDAQIYTYAGIILRDCSPNEQSLEDARRMFELSLNRCSADDPGRKHPLFGLFTYYIKKRDLKTAERYLRDAYAIDPAYIGYEPPLGDKWLKQMKDDSITKEMKPLWARVVKKEPSAP